ncbi:unnamed protein product [Dicrocoelium dendriticum]|nr:unnamed protein product [Dicrocoelium dendriticum]
MVHSYAVNSCVFVLGLLFTLWFMGEEEHVIYSGFSTKTAYRYCSLQPFVDRASEFVDENCQLVHVNVLFRHGTRAPSGDDVVGFEELHARLVSSTGAALPSGFEKHPIPFLNCSDRQLLPMGVHEMYTLGRTFREQSSSFFNFTPSNSRFFTSSSTRAIASGQSFYNGLFNLSPPDPGTSYFALPSLKFKNGFGQSNDLLKVDDKLLRFFDYCDRYVKEIVHNKSTLYEYTAFKNGPEMQHVLMDIISQHRLNESTFIRDDIYTIFLACAYEVAAYSDSDPMSPWCGFLKPAHQEVLEYLVDLKQFWRKSYGYDLNYVQSCPLVNEMVSQVKEAAEQFKSHRFDQQDVNLHRGTFWFGHAETVMPVVSALGLFNDSIGATTLQKLHADGFEIWRKKLHSKPQPPTMFRSGHIAPFAGNVALYLYHCPDSADSSDPYGGFRVQPRVNGQTVAWPIGSPVQPPTSQFPGSTSAPLSALLRYLSDCAPEVYSDEKVCHLKTRVPAPLPSM